MIFETFSGITYHKSEGIFSFAFDNIGNRVATGLVAPTTRDYEGITRL